MKKDNFLNRKRRVRARIQGTADRPRASIFRSLRSISIQLIDDEKGNTMVAIKGMVKKGQTKTEQAMAAGKDIAALAKEKGITKIVFDRSGHQYHGRLKAVAESMRQAGLEF